jgi:hypothetical protein
MDIILPINKTVAGRRGREGPAPGKGQQIIIDSSLY